MDGVLDINTFGLITGVGAIWRVGRGSLTPPSTPATVPQAVDEDAVGVSIQVVYLGQPFPRHITAGQHNLSEILSFVKRTAQQYSRPHEHRPSMTRESCEVAVLFHAPLIVAAT
jgi:hypothetical protein